MKGKLQTPLEVLNNLFGYDSFRGPQEEIIHELMEGRDALVLMPTGGGKSLCYQIPSLLREGTGVVVSPLIALMHNQVETLRLLGIRAAYLNSSLSFEEARQVEESLLSGNLDLLYVAPERISNPSFQSLLGRIRIALFAIDEAHCVSQWGHDFRPEYMRLSLLAERFPSVPRIGLTATADAITRIEMIEKLNLNHARLFLSSFDRPNIRYQIDIKQNAKKQLLDFIWKFHRKDSGIVYCLSRNRVEAVAQHLNQNGLNALPYHAGLSNEIRQEHQRRFLQEESIIIVATVAFGMGIDKPDVRFVAHMDLPRNLEGYYQETGRAGRDGKPADAWMVYSLADVIAIREMLENSDGSEEFKSVMRKRLNSLLGFCESTTCRRISLLRYFGEEKKEPCSNCDNCLNGVKTYDGTIDAQMVLSCIYRTGQKFGAGHVIDILRGKTNQRIQDLEHHKLSTYGIGKEKSDQQWRSVIRQLVAAGYLHATMETGGLTLDPSCRSLLKGETAVQLRVDRTVEKRDRKEKKESPGSLRQEQPDDPIRQELFENLRTLRTRIARENGVPPYRIFHDATLQDMVYLLPTTPEDLKSVNGVGSVKLNHYGEEFLDVIRGHVREYGLTGATLDEGS